MQNTSTVTGRPPTPWLLSHEEVEARYKAGESLTQLARACGLRSSNPVRSWLLKNGVVLRPPGGMAGRNRSGRPRSRLLTCHGEGCCNLLIVYPSANKKYCSPGCRYSDPRMRYLIGGSIESKHRLTSVDEETEMGECSVCGPTRIRIRADRRTLKFATPTTIYRCRTAERARDLAHRLGVSLAEVEALLKAQGGSCAICGRSFLALIGHGAQVDHCHSTGAIRGILCSSCNTGIGLLGEDVDRLKAAIRYLTRSYTDQ